MWKGKNIKYVAGALLYVAFFSSCRSQRQIAGYGNPQVTVPVQTVVPVASPVVPVPEEKPVQQQQVVVEKYKSLSSVEFYGRGTWEGEIQYALDSICNSGIMTTSQAGLYIYDLTSDRPIYALNENQRLRPASCQKLITSISSLEYLGGDYQFVTDLCITGTVSQGTLSGDVYVVGTMDPLLSKGDVRKLAEMLKSSGISKISGHLYLDVSMKDDLQYGWGWCWDDDYGPLSALTVDGKDEFSIHWIGALRNMGIGLSNKGVSFQICPSTANSIGKIIHSMDQILVPMMKDSENIFAESMFYQLATRSGQKSAGRKQAVPLVEALISHMGLQPERYCIADGSGLSLYNYASPILLATFLKHAYLNEPIRTHLYPSLPIAGIDGTLEKRMKESAAFGKVHAKTGSLSGISTLSGYAESNNGHLLVFSIMNQGVEKMSVGRDFQDEICRIICK